jgi:hypothetical protein
MHAYGGLYLDMDMECYRSSDAFLADCDLALNLQRPDQRSVITAVYASVPGHPFWNNVIRGMLLVRFDARLSQSIVCRLGLDNNLCTGYYVQYMAWHALQIFTRQFVCFRAGS